MSFTNDKENFLIKIIFFNFNFSIVFCLLFFVIFEGDTKITFFIIFASFFIYTHFIASTYFSVAIINVF